jgi:hypothetical protein
MPGMKATKTQQAARAAKAERRSRRSGKGGSGKGGSGRKHGDWEILPLGGPMDPALQRRAIDAFAGFDPSGPWPDVAPLIMPLLKRVRHPFPAQAAPLHLRVPPGVWTGFGVDVGPMWAHVSRELQARWGVDDATLLGTALENLRRRAVEDPPIVETTSWRGTETIAVQAQGWGSALILAPDRLGPYLGDEPRTLLTPVRNTLLCLPDEVELEMVVSLWQVFAEGSNDELDIDPLRWTGSTVIAYDEEVSTLLD